MSIRSRAFIAVAIVGLALGTAGGARTDSLFDLIMRVFGISATPSQMRGERDVTAGKVWIADLEGGAFTSLTTDSGYRWPVYERNGQAVVALKGDSLLRIPVTKGKVEVQHKIPGVEKLVGFDREDSDKLLVVLNKDTAPLAFLSLKTGNLTPLPYDSRSSDYRRLLSHIKGEERVYGTVRVYVKAESKQGMEGEVVWDEVYLQQGESEPRKVSNGDGVDCNQPSLSPDGKAVVYIKVSDTE